MCKRQNSGSDWTSMSLPLSAAAVCQASPPVFRTLPSHGRGPKQRELVDRTTQLANDLARICIQVTDSSGVFAPGALCKERVGESDLCNSQSEKTFWRRWFLKAWARQSLPATQRSEECAQPIGEDCRLLRSNKVSLCGHQLFCSTVYLVLLSLSTWYVCMIVRSAIHISGEHGWNNRAKEDWSFQSYKHSFMIWLHLFRIGAWITMGFR